ncbi:PIN domain-containing protein [Microbacterium esteraromaticum]|uniref:PIN domain-containing protein n=1 Tax=Microbacterium esteraromaticum TaxID=57043 RepID=UPI00236894E1|nr:PIN domain-containing protein [Microbacterium esteraromaticum]WDH78219.1 PIN domain-containing protein [Microbacterium esteraromaticum]
MKSKFRGYYPPSDDEMSKIWDEGLIVLDTNALLNILRYSAVTRDQLLDLLGKKKDQIWIPYQVGLEFHRKRRGMPGDLTKAFNGVQEALNDAVSNVETALSTLGRHAQPEADELRAAFQEHAKQLKKKVKRASEKHAEAVTSEQVQTATFNRISELYAGRVGEPYIEDDLKKLYREGTERYDKRLPPGYMDAADKKDERKYGDLVLWRQILDHAKNVKKPLLFVTDDNKEDWWHIASGKTVGARPELIEEYYEASGERAHFYNLRRYLAYAQERGEDISDESVAEVKKVSVQLEPSSAEQVARRMRATKRYNDLMRAMAEVTPALSTSEAYTKLAKAVGEMYPPNALTEPRVADFIRNYGETPISGVTSIEYPRAADFLLAKATEEQQARRSAVLHMYDRSLSERKRAAEAGFEGLDNDDTEDTSDDKIDE